MKQLAELVSEQYPGVSWAYWQNNWRRDAAPLLDELAASIDHVQAFARGGAHDASNFAAVCARCNARKSVKDTNAYLAESRPWKVTGKHGEPLNWDGMSALYVLLAKKRSHSLSATEKRWVAALEARLASLSEGTST